MKRRILVTVLALLLALGALVTLNSGHFPHGAAHRDAGADLSGRQRRGTGTDGGLPYRAG